MSCISAQQESPISAWKYKLIGWKDGFRAIYCIIKYNLFSR